MSAPTDTLEAAIPVVTRALHQQQGRVAIAGESPEWDHLGWMRHARETFTTTAAANLKRTEVLWTNYDPATWRRL